MPPFPPPLAPAPVPPSAGGAATAHEARPDPDGAQRAQIWAGWGVGGCTSRSRRQPSSYHGAPLRRRRTIAAMPTRPRRTAVRLRCTAADAVCRANSSRAAKPLLSPDGQLRKTHATRRRAAAPAPPRARSSARRCSRVEIAMPIALERGARFGRGAPPAAAAAACGGSSSVGRGSDSHAEAVHVEEAEEGDGEVQSSLRGPFDTMDALQESLPCRREVSKFYNSKSSSLANAGDVVLSPQSSKGLGNPETPSPKKRPIGDDTNSPTTCRKPLNPAITGRSPCKSRNDNERESCKSLHCQCLQRRFSDMNVFCSPPVTPQTQLISVQMGSISAVGQDVAESTRVVSPREKRRKN